MTKITRCSRCAASSIVPSISPPAGMHRIYGDKFGPLIPAYRYHRPEDGGHSIVFHCPFCNRLHWHGLPPTDSGLIHPRVSHCFDVKSPLWGAEYRLVVVGDVASPDSVPRYSANDIDSLNLTMREG